MTDMPADSAPEPRLSVILVTEEGGDGLARVLDRLAAQEGAGTLEIVVAAKEPHAIALPPERVAPFAALRVVAADTSTSARARAGAVRAARAPYVVLAEDHAFPVGTRWAARFLARLDEGYAGVGPLMLNANPATRTSRANLAVEYAPWTHAERAREVERIPGHNSAYPRALLLAYGERLAEMLEAEWVLHVDMRRQGHKLLHDPEIAVEHLNYSRTRRSLRLQFLQGRMFADSRASEWSRARRLAYALAWPAVPMVRLCRIVATLARARETRAGLPGSLPMIAALLAASGLGEGLGYAFGDGGQRRAFAQLEYRRWQNLVPGETHLAR